MSRYTNADILQAITEVKRDVKEDMNRLSDKLDLTINKVNEKTNELEVKQAKANTHLKVMWSILTAVGGGLVAVVIKVLF